MHSPYRDPPPYPGHSKQAQLYNNQPGLRQSFSGSETSTDISLSSSENLSTTQRQEPQGEETQSMYPPGNYDVNTSSDYSILARLGMPSSTFEVKPESCSSLQNQGNYSSEVNYLNSDAPWQNNQVYVGNHSPVNITKSSDYSHNHISSYQTPGQTHSTEWLNVDSHMISYLNKLPPPPEYPGMKQQNVDFDVKRLPGVYDRGVASLRSDSAQQYDVLLDSVDKTCIGTMQCVSDSSLSSIDRRSPCLSSPTDSKSQEYDQRSLVTHYSQMVELLSSENKSLREELAVCSKKVSKLQKFELEIQKVHECYESLVKSSQKRERLEATLKRQLQDEIRKLQSNNRELRVKVSRSAASSPCAGLLAVGGDLADNYRSDDSDAKLLGKNKELSATKERLEIETETQRGIIQEQRSQINILNGALTNAQCNVVQLEEECKKKQACMERLDQLHQKFISLQNASEKRENMEKQLRSRLEREIEKLKNKGETTKKDDSSTADDVSALKQLLNERDAKVLQLETENAIVEQKFLEESALRQFAMNQDTDPKDIKIAAIEQSSSDTEKLIAEAKKEKLMHMEEVYQANRRGAELESKIKSLETQLAEKEAMVRLFQKSPMTRSSSVHTLHCSPLHSPRPSLVGTGSLGRHCQLDTSYQHPTIKHCKTSSSSALELGRKASLDDGLKVKLEGLNLQIENETQKDTEEETGVWRV